jgi:hypothetical protein
MNTDVPFNPKDIFMNQTSSAKATARRSRRTPSPRVAKQSRKAKPQTHLSQYMEFQFRRWLRWIEDHSQEPEHRPRS